MAQRRGGAIIFLAIVGGVAGLAWPRRYPVQVGTIAVEGIGRRKLPICFGCDPAGVAGTKPDHREPAIRPNTVHLRTLQVS